MLSHSVAVVLLISLLSSTSALAAAPGDFDGDRIPDELELALGTDPRSADATTVLSGHVRFDDGTPAAGATIAVQSVSAELLSGTANGNGAFTLPVAWPVVLTPVVVSARLVVPGTGAFEGSSARTDAVAGGLTSFGDVFIQQHVTAEGSLFPGARYHTGFDGAHVADAADFNGDGLLDLVQASLEGNLVQVRNGTGDGLFGSGIEYAVGSAPSDLLLADFNGDDLLDLVTANRDSGDLSVLLGMPNGRFSSALNIPVGNAPRRLASADLDLDGDVDLAVAHVNGLDSLVLINEGTGFTMTPLSGPGDTELLIEFGDVDADGVPDLVCSDASGLGWRSGLGDGSFGTLIPLSSRQSRSVDFADVDLDGRLDLVSLEAVSFFAGLWIYPGLDGGGLAAGVNTSAPVYSFGNTLIKAGDITGDGLPDVLFGDGEVFVLPGSGTFAFSTVLSGSLWATGLWTWSLVARDLDADGDRDLLVGGDDGMVVATNEGDGTLPQPDNFLFQPAEPGAGNLMAPDLNVDGNPDLLYTQSEYVVARAGNGDGTFSNFWADMFEDGQALDLVLANFDSNDTLDVATVDSYLDRLVVHLLEPDGTVATSGNSNGGLVIGTELASGDVNGDGFTDIVVREASAASVMLGDGTKFFGAPIATAIPGLSHLVVSELNGDEFADALVVHAQLERVSLYPGQADGTFGSATSELSVPEVSKIVVADLNADGQLDLVTSSRLAERLSVYLGAGDGSWTLAPGSPISVGDRPDIPSVADVDGDGIQDIVVDTNGHRVVLLGRADGSFIEHYYVALNQNPNGPAIADFNHDGAVDIAGSAINYAYGILYGIPRD